MQKFQFQFWVNFRHFISHLLQKSVIFLFQIWSSVATLIILTHFSSRVSHAFTSVSKSLLGVFPFIERTVINSFVISNSFIFPCAITGNDWITWLTNVTAVVQCQEEKVEMFALFFNQSSRFFGVSSIHLVEGRLMVARCQILFYFYPSRHISTAESTKHLFIKILKRSWLTVFCQIQSWSWLLDPCVKLGKKKRKKKKRSLLLLQLCCQRFRCLLQLCISQHLEFHVHMLAHT